MKIHVLSILSLLSVTGLTLAQECPPGFYPPPAGTYGPCTRVQPAFSNRVDPSLDRYGAVVASANSIVVIKTNFKKQEEAIKAAMEACESDKNGPKGVDCTLIGTYRNACASVYTSRRAIF